MGLLSLTTGCVNNLKIMMLKGSKAPPPPHDKCESREQNEAEGSGSSSLSHRMKRLVFLSGNVLAGVLIALLFHYTFEYVAKTGWPKNTFLYTPQDRFNDLVNSIFCVLDKNPYYENAGRVAAYFPFAYLCLMPFIEFSMPTAVCIFLVGSILCFCLLCFWWSRLRFGKGERFLAFYSLCVLSLASYPFIFALDRGNLDVWIGMLLVFFLIGLRIGKSGILLAVVALASATAIKGYPALFILLFLVERRYLAATVSIVLAGLFTLGSLFIFIGDIGYHLAGIRSGLKYFHEAYVVGTGSLNYCVDPYNCVRFFMGTTDRVQWGLKLFSFVLLGFSSFFVLFAPAAPWRKTLTVGITLLLFPVVANDYKLLVLLPGIFEFVAQNEPLRKQDKIIMFCLILLFVPKHYYFFGTSAFSISCVVSPILVLLMAFTLFADFSAWRIAIVQFPKTFHYYLEPFLRLFRRLSPSKGTP